MLFVFVFGQTSEPEYYSYLHLVLKTLIAHRWLLSAGRLKVALVWAAKTWETRGFEAEINETPFLSQTIQHMRKNHNIHYEDESCDNLLILSCPIAQLLMHAHHIPGPKPLFFLELGDKRQQQQCETVRWLTQACDSQHQLRSIKTPIQEKCTKTYNWCLFFFSKHSANSKGISEVFSFQSEVWNANLILVLLWQDYLCVWLCMRVSITTSYIMFPINQFDERSLQQLSKAQSKKAVRSSGANLTKRPFNICLRGSVTISRCLRR